MNSLNPTLFEIFRKLANSTPTATAVRHENVEYTYGELLEMANSAEAAIFELLSKCGTQTPDPIFICYWGENHPLALVLPLVCSKLGLTYVPISPLYPEERVKEIVTSLNGFLFGFENLGSRPKLKSTDLLERRERQEHLLGFYTSGTTGAPKLALIPESQILTNTEAAIQAQNLGRTDRVLAGLSLCHSGGLGIQALPGLLSGARLNLVKGLTPDVLADSKDDSNVMLLVPSFLQKLKLSRHNDQIIWKRFRLVGIGSAAFTADLIAPLLEAGTTVMNIYGLTEAGPVLFTEKLKRSEVPSIGLATTDTEWRIDPQTAELLVRGQIAQTVYRSENSIQRVHDENGWFNTRDRVELRNGKLYFLGRTNATFNIGGMKVHAEKVEAAIEGIPGVDGCLLVSRKHSVFGEILVAKVELTDSSLSKRQLIKMLRTRHPELTRYEIPREIEFVEKLARSTIGKKLRGRA